MQKVLSFDFETLPIRVGSLAPEAVCCGLAERDEQGTTAFKIGHAGDGNLASIVDFIVNSDYPVKIAHNLAFDLAVLVSNFPQYLPQVLDQLEKGIFRCTRLTEKMLALATSGNLNEMILPNGQKKVTSFSLNDLSIKYLGEDRSSEKDDPASWRTNYGELKGLPVSQWPKEATEYLLKDCISLLPIHDVQQKTANDLDTLKGITSLRTLPEKCCVDFALFITSCRGLRVDPEQYHKLHKDIEEKTDISNFRQLVDLGIVVPAKEGRPYANGALNADGTPKMTASTPEKLSKTTLIKYVEELAKANPNIVPLKTEATEKYPEGQISVKAEWLNDFAHMDSVLTEYQTRQGYQKMLTTELPRLCCKVDGKSNGIPSPIVHPNFNALVETGRTSSFGSELYPSLNGQNVDPEARLCIIPRDGFVLFSCDYNQMELITLAQTHIRLFGKSKLADLINAGIDVHVYTGSQLAFNLHNDFKNWVLSMHPNPTADDIYKCFKFLDKPETSAFFKHFRTFAKPTNLGYPGGLGPKKFVTYAKSTYGVLVDIDMATRLREIWMAAIPEMEPYFDAINRQYEDPYNVAFFEEEEDFDPKANRAKRRYAYSTPGGLYRAGATYCAACNGLGLQSSSAELATKAFYSVLKACLLPNLGYTICVDSKGRNTYPQIFIHDEIVGETREDGYESDRVVDICRIMQSVFQLGTPDVRVNVQGCLMRRWYKDAKPIRSESGRLQCWEPSVK